jgi:CBS domain-containing protein
MEPDMRVGEILVKQGYVSEQLIGQALEKQATTRQRIGEILVDAGFINETILHNVLTFQKTLEKDRLENKQVFLKSTIPFDALSEQAIEKIAADMELSSFFPGEGIIKQGTPGTHFFLVKNGLVKVFLEEEGKETVLGFLGEGDCFGEISLLTDGPATANIQCVEYTLCLVQPKEKFLEMAREHPVFYQFFNRLLTQRLKGVYKELLSENPGIGQVEPFLYRKQVKDLFAPSQPFCAPRSPIREAARVIVEKGAGIVVVVDEQGRPQGTLGVQDIVKSVLLGGVDAEQPVETIMERDYHSIDTKRYFFDALHEMVLHKTNELIVLEGEKAEGVLTGFDLLRFRGREVLSLLRNIEGAPDFAHMGRMRGEVERVLKALMTDGALASQACKIVSEFNDKMVRRVIKLVEEGMGAPPCRYAWLGLGSEGRREQTLITDQDNAILFSGGPTGESAEYFAAFSTRVVDGLNRCGFPLCKGGVMANQPKFFGDLKDWKARAGQWAMPFRLQEENLSDIYTFLDFRALSGDFELERDLKSHVLSLIKESPSFLRTLAQGVTSIPIPLGFFKNFIVEKSGKYKNRLNLKLYGLVPLVTYVKLLALGQGIVETNTLERIKALCAEQVFSSDQGEFLEQAFETFLTLKIRNNLNDIEQGKEFGNHIDPAELSTRQKQLLKEAFLAVSQLQKTTRSLLRVEE